MHEDDSKFCLHDGMKLYQIFYSVVTTFFKNFAVVEICSKIKH